ncbi:polysaccharide deacetylase family protein [Pseudodesulfovibrio indicus]|uniref:polysaccharide deacetylase family protein n=1 Tax=Pseudodesulfovibrio indicus TaxID=1716143 RepID=UPI00292CCF4B|nr:polysaccharide deacetylase family protein [Pseudodesulfovibrio indicus]
MTIDYMKTLLHELDAWKDAGRTAEFWWRDDDAAEPSVELDRLIRLSDRFGVPCGLATVPALAGEPLRKGLSHASHIWILQHGYAHKNRAKSGGGAWELGAHRPKSEVLEELRQGMGKLTQLFKGRFVPVLVPPWNRIDPELFPYLPVMGYRGLSTSYKKGRPNPSVELRVADAHCDVLHWKDKPAVRFSGTEKCVKLLVNHLRDKRTGEADASEPTCLLTHHMVMDNDAWEFVEALFGATSDHPAAAWITPAEIWPPKA